MPVGDSSTDRAAALSSARKVGLTLAVAAAVVVLSLDNGAYGLVSRGTLAIATWWLIILAVVFGLWPRARPPKAALLTCAAFIGLAGLTMLSIAWSDSAERAWVEGARVLMYLGVLVAVVLAARREDATAWVNGLAAGVALVALLALASRLFPDLIDPGRPASFVPAQERLSYPLDYWNGLAIFVALGFPLLLRAAIAEDRWYLRSLAVAPLPAISCTIYLTSSRGGVAVAATAVVLFVVLTQRRVLAFLAIALSGLGSAAAVAVLQARPTLVDDPFTQTATSQGASAAPLIALACVVTALLYGYLSRLPVARSAPRLSLGVKLAAVAVAAVALVAALIAIHPAQRFEDFKQPSRAQRLPSDDFTRAHLLSGYGSGRWQLWGSAVEQFKVEPLRGQGAGSYEAWWTEHATITKFVRDAHSLYLETLGELGMVGLVLLLAVFGTGFASAGVRLRSAPMPDRVTLAALCSCLAGFALGAAIDWVWELTIVTVVAVVVLGLLVGPATDWRGAALESEKTWRPASNRIMLALMACTVVFGMVAITINSIPTLANERIEASREAASRQDTEAALRAARQAGKIEPWAASPRVQLALVEEQARDLEAARRAIGEALERDPADWRTWLIAARIEAKSGKANAARASLRRAGRLNPRSALFSQEQ